MKNSPSKALWSGLTKPSFCALFVALGTVLAIFALIFLTITEDTLPIGKRNFFPINARDLDAYATVDAIAMSRAVSDERPVVVVAGASDMREMLLSSEHLSNQIQLLSGLDVPVYNLTTGGQTLLETLWLTTKLDPKRKGVFVFGLGQGNLSRDDSQVDRLYKDQRLGIRSLDTDRLAQELGFEIPSSSGIYAVDNYKFIFLRINKFLQKLLAGREIEPQYHRYMGRTQSEKTWRRRGPNILRKFSGYDQNYEMNRQILTKLVEQIHSLGNWQIILVEAPMNPRFVTEFLTEELQQDFVRKMNTFALQNEVQYIRMAEIAAYTSDDFYDWTHLNTLSAQRSSTDALAIVVAKAISKP